MNILFGKYLDENEVITLNEATFENPLKIDNWSISKDMIQIVSSLNINSYSRLYQLTFLL